MQLAEAESADNAPVIAVGEVVRGGSSYLPVSKMCLRDQVITELVSRYGCFVAYRSASYGAPAEDPLGVPIQPDKAFPADLLVSGFYNSPSVEPGAIEGLAVQYDLTTPDYRKEISTQYKAKSLEAVPAAIADLVAARVKAGKKSAIADSNISTRGWKIAVMPFTRMNLKFRHKELVPNQTALTAALQTALQAKVTPGQVSIENRLDLNTIAGQLNAVVLGSFSDIGNGSWRTDLHLIDPESLLIISASSTVFRGGESNIDFADLVDGLFENIKLLPPERPGESKQLMREVKSYYIDSLSPYILSTFTPGSGSPIYMASTARYIALRACERAYHLKSDNPYSTYMGIWILSNLIGLNSVGEYEFTSEHGGADFSENTANLLLQLLKNPVKGWDRVKPEHFSQMRFGPRVIHPQMLKAETLAYLHQYDEAIQLASEGLNIAPDNERLTMVMVTALAAKGRDDEAKAGLTRWIQKHGESDRTRVMNLLVAKEDKDDSGRYAALRKAVTEAKRLADKDDWEYYLKVLPEKEGPAKAIEELSVWLAGNRRGAVWPMGAQIGVRLRQAECFEMLGKKEAAYHRAEDVLATLEGWPGAGTYRNKANALIKRVEGETGKLKSTWLMPSELKVDASKYKIYVASLGDGLPDALMKEVGTWMTRFLGIKCEALPANPMAYPGSYDKTACFKTLFTGYSVPSDAVMVCFVTKWRLGHHDMVTSARGNPMIYTSSSYQEFDAQGIRYWSKMIAAHLAQSFQYSYSSKVTHPATYPVGITLCPNDPCMFSDYPGSYSSDLRFSICPACQKEYNAVKFDDINKGLTGHLKALGAVIE